MDWVPINGRFLSRSPDHLHQLKIMVFGSGEVVRFWTKRVDVVTGHHDGTLGNVVLGADEIDTQNCGVTACQFSAEGATCWDWARNLSVAEQLMIGAGAFDNCG